MLMHRFGSSDPRGTIWVWCGSCGSYAHFSAVVPTWWSNPEFVDYPDSISSTIDEWANGRSDERRVSSLCP